MDESERLIQLADAIKQKAWLQSRTSFYAFVRLMAHYMLDGEAYVDGAHIRAICNVLELVEAGRCTRLMTFLPPRSMKSVLLMLFVAWCMGRNPKWRIMWISHTTEKAEECSGRIRDLLREPDYLGVFPDVDIRKDMQGIQRWKLTAGGSFLPAGAGKSIAGYGFTLGILDDPLSEQTAASDLEREKINRWYGPGFRSRKNPNSRIVLVNTRWHVRDLAGVILDQAEREPKADQWTVISIPAILNEAAATFLGLPEGGSYWPEFISLEDLLSTRESRELITKANWASLYMQTPVAAEGNIFQADSFQDWPEEEPPDCEEIIFSIDGAYGRKETNDFSVIQVWGIFYKKVTLPKGEEVLAPNAILLFQEKGRWAYPEFRKKTLKLIHEWNPDRVIVEKKASGISLIQDLEAHHIPVLPFNPDRDKIARANATTGVLEKKRIWLPYGKTYSLELLKEALAFPRAPHDDQVDAMVMALLYLRKLHEIAVDVEPDEIPTKRRANSYWRSMRDAGRRRAA